MAPGDMALHPGDVQGYNEIVKAGSDAVIGLNPGINESELISGTKGDKAFQGKIAPLAGTVHRGPQAAPVATQPAPSSVAELPLQREEKAALVTAGITRPSGALALEQLEVETTA